MPNDPLFNEPGTAEKLARDPQIMAMVARGQWVRFIAGLVLLVVLAAILLTSIFG